MNEITGKIGLWYDHNHRDLPWRHTRNAYLIWLSEIILQQTRVAQGIDYYHRFVQRFPTVAHLAAATEDEVLKLWQGLGYYSRARNLLKAARQVNGSFPTRYAELRQLQGIGPYTAAAIASFAADEAVAVVDGNVYRVLSRLFDLDTPIDTTQGQKQYQLLADNLLAEALADGNTRSSHHNQALMEFGALHCTPTSPHCTDCPVAAHCLALANGSVALRPRKQGKVKVRQRHLAYIIYIYRDTLWVHQRGEGDIWQGLWEYCLASDAPTAGYEGPGVCIHQMKHQLTHQTLYATFWAVRLDDNTDPQQQAAIRNLAPGYKQVTWMEWQQLAVPRLIDEANKRLSAWF